MGKRAAIAIGTTAAALAALGWSIPIGSSQIITFDGRQIEFAFTDENAGEDLIIRTDREQVAGISTADFYLSVENLSGKAQQVDISVLTKDSSRQVTNIRRMLPGASRTVDEPLYEERNCKKITRNGQPYNDCDFVQVGTTTKRVTEDLMIDGGMMNSAVDRVSEIIVQGKTPKGVGGTIATGHSSYMLRKGEVGYFHVEVHLPSDPKRKDEKFYVEAIGNKGGYGHLDPWFNSSWNYRFSVASDPTKVDEAIEACYYDLTNAPAGFWTQVASDGGDIRVTRSDGTTEVAREVSGFSVAGTDGGLYFACTDIDIASASTYYVYYGNPAASEPAPGASNGRELVWPAEFEAVWHIDETANNSAGGYQDATDNNRDMTGSSMSANAVSTPIAGKGQAFDGTADYISFPSFGTLFSGSDDYTVTLWVNTDSLAHDQAIFMPRADYDVTVSLGTDTIVHSVWNGGFNGAFSDFGVIGTGNWYHIGARRDAGTNLDISYNGAAVVGTHVGNPIPDTTGGTSAIGWFSWGGDYFEGDMDEFYVISEWKTNDWLSTIYDMYNSPSTFWTTGTQELGTPPNQNKLKLNGGRLRMNGGYLRP